MNYGIIYLVQSFFVLLVYISAGSYNLGFMIVLYELNNQYEILLEGIKNSFNFKMDHRFEKHFIECIRQHQLIIK